MILTITNKACLMGDRYRPDRHYVRYGTSLSIAVSDQHRQPGLLHLNELGRASHLLLTRAAMPKPPRLGKRVRRLQAVAGECRYRSSVVSRLVVNAWDESLVLANADLRHVRWSRRDGMEGIWCMERACCACGGAGPECDGRKIMLLVCLTEHSVWYG